MPQSKASTLLSLKFEFFSYFLKLCKVEDSTKTIVLLSDYLQNKIYAKI